jgi:hypothetical protein
MFCLLSFFVYIHPPLCNSDHFLSEQEILCGKGIAESLECPECCVGLCASACFKVNHTKQDLQRLNDTINWKSGAHRCR